MLLFGSILNTAFADIYEDIASSIRKGDAKQLALFFGNTVDITLLEQENISAKAQAELIIKEFFTKNPPKIFSIIHKGASKEGTMYAIGNLTTIEGKIFRISYFLKSIDGKNLIQEIRIETA
ncbi:MAG: hypothetical protein RIQ89_1638 [Bacteroidota bacterium]